VLHDAPAAGEQGEPAFAQAAQGTLKRVAGAGIEVKFPAAGWLLDRDEDADPGAVVPRVGEGGQASCGGPVQGGQGMGAGRSACCPRRSARWRPWSPLPATVALP
jgi:hypothetical protein